MYKMYSSEFQSHSMKIEDFQINSINTFLFISTKGNSGHVKLITKNVFLYAQDGEF